MAKSLFLNEMKALHISHFSKKVLELFKGTGSVGHVAKEFGFEVISLDNERQGVPLCTLPKKTYHCVEEKEVNTTIYFAQNMELMAGQGHR